MPVCLSVSDITEKGGNGFSRNLQDKFGIEQGPFWNISG